jgi:ribulose-phosphate 3-epimerase
MLELIFLVSGTTVFKSNNGDIKKNINLLKLK